MMKQKGSILLYLLFIQSILMILSLATIKTIKYYSDQINSAIYQKQVFYLAQSGIEISNNKLINNPSWFTDPPHYPSDDKEWLYNNSVGDEYLLPDCGNIKIIREHSKNILYSIGYIGDNNKLLSRKIVKIEFSLPFTIEARSFL